MVSSKVILTRNISYSNTPFDTIKDGKESRLYDSYILDNVG